MIERRSVRGQGEIVTNRKINTETMIRPAVLVLVHPYDRCNRQRTSILIHFNSSVPQFFHMPLTIPVG